MKTLKTTTGNEIEIETAQILVSANHRIDTGYFDDLELIARLPRCRKFVKMTVTPMPGGIWIKPLFGHSGAAYVRPEDWERFVDGLAVFPDERIGNPYRPTFQEICDIKNHWGKRMADSVKAQQEENARWMRENLAVNKTVPGQAV